MILVTTGLESGSTPILVTLSVAVIAPLLLSWLNNRAAIKREAAKANIDNAKLRLQWDRDDEVTKRVEDAAALLVKTNKEQREAAEKVASLAAGVAEESRLKMKDLGDQVERVHKLVNSDMTAARRDQKNEAIGRLNTMKRIVALDVAAGREPAKEDLDEIKSTEEKIAELEAILADRLVQARAVEAQEEAEAARITEQ